MGVDVQSSNLRGCEVAYPPDWRGFLVLIYYILHLYFWNIGYSCDEFPDYCILKKKIISLWIFNFSRLTLRVILLSTLLLSAI